MQKLDLYSYGDFVIANVEIDLIVEDHDIDVEKVVQDYYNQSKNEHKDKKEGVYMKDILITLDKEILINLLEDKDLEMDNIKRHEEDRSDEEVL